jgi:hypothetical protein
METYRAAHDGLGFATADQQSARSSPFDTTGIRQIFAHGAVYSSKYGVFYVRSLSCFTKEGGSAGWLGFPVEESKFLDHVSFQEFEGGRIYLNEPPPEKDKAYAVRHDVLAELSDQLFRPVSQEIATESPFGNSGTVQRVEVRRNDAWLETAVYWSGDYGYTIFAPEIWSYYHKLGPEGSRLGFPSPAPELWRVPRASASERARRLTQIRYAPEEAEHRLDPAPRAMPYQMPAHGWADTSAERRPKAMTMAQPRKTVLQFFQGGVVYWRLDTGAFAVTGPVFETIASVPELRDKLGWPVSEQLPIGLGDTDVIQFFDNGNVTLRDGKREIWLRPEAQEPAPDPYPYRR